MQEHTAKKVRITILLWLMFLAMAFPDLVNYYEQRYVYQWQELVRPHWEPVAEPLASVRQDLGSEDVAEWKDIAVDRAADASDENPALALPSSAMKEAVVQDNPAPASKPDAPRQKKMTTASRKKSELTLNLPENIYHERPAVWDEKKPVVIPDFFSPRTESSSGLKFGGRLIVDEDKMKKKQQDGTDPSYLDAVQGAEINIKMETK